MTIIKKFEPEPEKNKLPRKYIVISLVALFILALIEIWVSNTVIVYGEKFEKLAELQENFLMENQILENEIATNSSLATIASKSAELGFSPFGSVQYIR